MIHERHTCRACGSAHLCLILDLGKTALANDFIEPAEIPQYTTCLPLRVQLCRECSLVQLAEIVDPGVLYSRYAYVTSTSRTMEAHLAEQCRHLLDVGGFAKPPRVLEIASNTGLFLQKFKAQGCEVLGVEPARNISEVATRAGITTWTDFFNSPNARRIRAEWGAADLILGRHVFAHIDDLQDLLAGLETVSHATTLIAFEVPYLVDFFERTEFDTVYHEHLSYIPVAALEAMLAPGPFVLQRVDHYPIHGGSILFHLRRRPADRPAHASVQEFLDREQSLHLAELAAWQPFADRVRHIQTALPALIRGLKAQGKSIIGYGASAKGNTLLNTCGLNAENLDYIIDNTPFKQGKVAPGSWVPIRPPEWLLRDQPDYALLLAWNFASEIVRRETEYQRRGGRFILPIPEPKVVEFAP
ncbi:MAG: class I SAM-dependent methyltransferase [Chloroflexi bacterium]|nr:class I SAM-dependent methyltransferase [Chloroflexota bacterium]